MINVLIGNRHSGINNKIVIIVFKNINNIITLNKLLKNLWSIIFWLNDDILSKRSECAPHAFTIDRLLCYCFIKNLKYGWKM